MILPDVNVLVYATHDESSDHLKYKAWLEDIVKSGQTFALCDSVLSGFIRIVTHPRIFAAPTPLVEACHLVNALRSHPQCAVIAPGPRHWDIFMDLCKKTGARGNLVPDAYLAALAMESGSELMSNDRGFARFPGLRWRHPFEE